MMSQQRQFHLHLHGGGNNNNDTTYTKIFVGGLAWETHRDTMRRYFEQFGEILEAVVITDKNTGRSKGYGFVTFKDPESAMRSCQNPSPVIDGRRANCNLASLASRPHHHGSGRLRSSPAANYNHAFSSTYLHHQPTNQYTFPYGYTGYSQDTMYPMNYYNIYGGQQLSPYYTTTGASSSGMYQNYYPYYPQYLHNTHSFGVQYPYLPPQNYATTGILSLPSSMPMTTTSSTSASGGLTTTTTTSTIAVTGTRASEATVCEQKSST